MTKSEKRQQLTSRIKECCKILGDSAGLAKTSGIPKRTIDSYLYSDVEPKWSNLEAIGLAAHVSFDWLIAGVGPMRRTEGAPVVQEMATDYHSSFEDFALIPGYNIQVSAGPGRINDEESITRRLAFRRRWLKFKGLNEKDLVVVFAKGDSMEPTISDNNTIMVDTSDTSPQDGRMYVIRFDGHLLVKRTQVLPGQGVKLISDNKAYEDQLVKFDGSNPDLEVIGRVVWVGRDY